MKRTILKTTIYIFVLFLISFAIIEGLILYEGQKSDSVKVDYVIILGARLYGDRPSPALIERLDIAKTYLQKNPDVKVIVSGGQGPDETIPEAHAMKNYLLNNNINEERIIVEDKSTNTLENLKFSSDKIDKKEGSRLMIATNKHHIFRSKLLAKRLGFIPYGLPAKIPPTVIVQSYIREYFAVIKSLIFDR